MFLQHTGGHLVDHVDDLEQRVLRPRETGPAREKSRPNRSSGVSAGQTGFAPARGLARRSSFTIPFFEVTLMGVASRRDAAKLVWVSSALVLVYRALPADGLNSGERNVGMSH